MEIQGKFEPVFKMNRLGNSSALPLPVKFRQVLYDPKLVEKELMGGDPVSDQDSELSEAESMLLADSGGKLFFKDPLQYPEYIQQEEEQSEQEDIFKLMEEGHRLMNLLKEQQIQQGKKAASEQMAGLLVNNLLINGFHIVPPESTPRPVDDSWTLPDSEADQENVVNVFMGDQLIVDMHRELKRLQIN
ncbi:unnamed protein product [Candidula unifasciata]|uniref:Uncharacterized protein n=1 Tax=Candidula unifasciata TaxID=100452 RepID=A0A8S3ZYS0_9EUPU|nr:unnamed protein product [Candidula unifasciata]